eukprot:5652197-Amphidinium_carterae.1
MPKQTLNDRYLVGSSTQYMFNMLSTPTIWRPYMLWKGSFIAFGLASLRNRWVWLRFLILQGAADKQLGQKSAPVCHVVRA